MTPNSTLANLPIQIPDPDQIRAAIEAADEKARLLRRLLRLALRLRLSLTTADQLHLLKTTKGGHPNG